MSVRVLVVVRMSSYDNRMDTYNYYLASNCIQTSEPVAVSIVLSFF